MSKSTSINDIHKGAIILALFLIGSYALSFAALHHHYADALRHFIFQYMIGSVILGAFFCFRKSQIWVTLMVIILICTSVEYISALHTNRDAAITTTSFKLLHFNKLYNQANQKDLIAFIETESPDIAIIQEADAAIIESSKALLQYKHRVSRLEGAPFSMLIISKHPLHNTRIIPTIAKTKVDNFYISTDIQITEEHTISLYAVHPTPPISKPFFDQRNQEIQQFSDDARNDKSSTIIMAGDFNITPFSPYFKRLKDQTGLRNEYTTWFIPPTWTSRFFDYIFQIPIDHVLHKGDIHLISKRRGAHMGSDHYPIIAEFGLK